MPDANSRALAAAARGLKLFPLRPGTKLPAVAAWPQVATSDPAQIGAWAAQFPDCGWGVHCEGLLALDIDVKNGAKGPESLLRLELANGDIPRTASQATPSGGRHYIMRVPHDVPNSASKLGPGLDVRGRSGFVALYDLDDTPIADAPDWLVQKAGMFTERERPADVNAADNPADVAHAIAYLQECPPAVEGKGGDARTFAVACAIRDFGLSEDTARDLMLAHWNPNCLPPWEPEALAVKVANAYRYATNALGVASATALFDPLPAPAAPAPNPGRFRRARRLADIPAPPMLVEGLIPQGALVALGALPGRSKSEHATCLAYAIATGAPDYLGRAIAEGDWAVAYVDLERLPNTERRLALYANADGRDIAEVAVELTGGPFHLNRAESVTDLIADLRALEQTGGRKLGLVVVDALGAATAGEDSNAAAAASLVGHSLRLIRDHVGCAVLVVAHSPKSGESTIAGSVQFDAIFDVSMFVESEDNGHTGNLRVQKDNVMALEESERKVGWERVMVRGATQEGREVRAFRFVPGVAVTKAPTGGPRGPRMDPTQQAALTVLQDRTLGGQSLLFSEWVAAVMDLCPDLDEAARRRRTDRVIANLLGGTAKLAVRDGLFVAPGPGSEAPP
jgi:hypothetical protein